MKINCELVPLRNLAVTLVRLGLSWKLKNKFSVLVYRRTKHKQLQPEQGRLGPSVLSRSLNMVRTLFSFNAIDQQRHGCHAGNGIGEHQPAGERGPVLHHQPHGAASETPGTE